MHSPRNRGRAAFVSFSPRFEAVERRVMPATFFVTSAADDGPGTLRQAILAVDANQADTIDFHIGGGGLQTIAPISPLPAVTSPAVIDGTSQPGYAGLPLIELDGSNAGVNADGLVVTAGHTAIAGLVINRFVGAGVVLQGGGGNTVKGCIIGTDPTGLLTQEGNDGRGVLIDNSPGNTIGGASAGSHNLISGNGADGVLILGAGASGNVVQGNLIGTDITGTSPIPNFAQGLEVRGAPGTTIGGTAPAAGNVISGNRHSGVLVSDDGSDAAGTVIQGNYIGTDITGTSPVTNIQQGILLIDATGARIGGPGPGEGNLISGNGTFGVAIGSSSAQGGTTGALVQGNRIGTDVTGSVGLSNSEGGVYVSAAAGNTIGGTLPGDGNVISGNAGNGVTVTNLGASSNLIQGNLIGVGATGTAFLGNAASGVEITGSAADNTVGGTDPLAGNTIGTNLKDGVLIDLNANHNSVLGNFIGTNRDGVLLSNFGNGVDILGAADNTIGGTTAAARNVIAANDQDGVTIGRTSSGNAVEGNYIGLAPSGELPLGNSGSGVFLLGAINNTIGGTAPGAGNVIAFNSRSGVDVSGFTLSPGNVVAGNFIGTDASGTLAFGNAGDGVTVTAAGTTIARNLIAGNQSNGVNLGTGATGATLVGNVIGLDSSGRKALANSLNGVFINGSTGVNVLSPTGVTIGGTQGDGNVISGNGLVGVLFAGAGAYSDVVEGNTIGLDDFGTKAVPNAQGGVSINSGANHITVGGAASGARNVISGNGLDGALISQPDTTSNVVQGNFIGTDPTGEFAIGNARSGVVIDDSPGNTVVANALSGNLRDGVEIDNAGATGNVVQANVIGADSTSSRAVPNADDGVAIVAAPGNLIGGASAGAMNVISGNLGNGVSVTGTTAASILGNRIGTDGTGLRPLGNGGDGVLIHSSSRTFVGKALNHAGNLISANGQAGVEINGVLATGNLVAGNTIGPDVGGESLLGIGLNTGNPVGVEINNAPSNTIGGAGALARNIISGNNRADGSGVGVEITGPLATGNTVVSDFIGIDALGNTLLANDTGVVINGAARNVIGGLTAVPGTGLGNVIAGPVRLGTAGGGAAVQIAGAGAIKNVVEGNLIGTNAAGTRRIGAALGGIGVLLNNTPGANIVGGTTTRARNIISGFQIGVEIYAPQSASNPTTANFLWGNFIGTDVTGKVPLGNTVGVFVNGVASNLIGGPTATPGTGPGNVISGNQTGVYLFGATATGNTVEGNLIGLDPTGKTAEGNHIGVFVNGASKNLIGGTSASARNVIAGNLPAGGEGSTGIYIYQGAVGNAALGNYIGTDINGRPGKNLGQGDYGILLYNAPANSIPTSGKGANKILGSGIAPTREFSSTAPRSSTSAAVTTRVSAKAVPSGPRALGRGNART